MVIVTRSGGLGCQFDMAALTAFIHSLHLYSCTYTCVVREEGWSFLPVMGTHSSNCNKSVTVRYRALAAPPR